MYKIIALCICVTLISGCASFNTQVIDAQTVTSLKNQTVTYTTRKKPDFAAMTAGKATFAMLGAIAMISAGNSIIEENDIPDPANAIAINLVKALEARHASRVVTPPLSVNSDDPVQIAGSTNGAAKFIVDVQTINWSFVYFPTDWTHYRVIYTAKARLIDAGTKKVVAEGFCKHIPDNNINAPTHDELLANKAAGLKKQLAAIADECSKNIKVEMLSI